VKFIEDRKFADPATVIKSAIESDRVARSRNVIEKPDPTRLQDWKGYGELGWTDDAAKYGAAIEKPKPGQGEVLDEKVFGEFTKLAHGAKVAPWQAKQIFDGLFKFVNGEVAAADAKGAKALSDLEEGLKKDWGQDYNGNKERARRAMVAFGVGAEDGKELDAMLGAPRMVKLFHAISSKLGEDQLPAGGGGGGGGDLPMTIAATEAAIRALHGDENFVKVMDDARHPQNKDFIAKRQRLISHLAKLKGAA
jgi:hypothetical protein